MNGPRITSADQRVADLFGSMVFTDDIIRRTMPQAERFFEIRESGKRIPDDLVDAYAHELRRWASRNGCTHWSHSFAPLSGANSAKQDAFLVPDETGQQITFELTGADMRQQEPDASSFPSGGTRPTHAARGYTVWDPTVPPYILGWGSTRSLYIPAVFFGWNGLMLDKRVPLLRSDAVLKQQMKRLLAAVGEDDSQSVWSSLGLEQEFFLIDRDYYLQRPDLVQTQRTLLGAPSNKGQLLDDHYFTDPGHRSEVLDEIDHELWKLGVPILTRHKEVAPAQYEMAPLHEPTPLAALHSTFVLRTMDQVARRHGLAALLHEKPFAGLNGSARHANYSVNTSEHPVLFRMPKAGKKPQALFLLSITAALRAVHLHGDVLRFSIASASNDHRLGGHEAPPPIMSVYLGEALHNLMEGARQGERRARGADPGLDIGIGVLPKVRTHPTDRNRTSPFAYTENRFEFRACGSSQSASDHGFALNTVFADSFAHLASEVEAARADGLSIDEAVDKVLRTELDLHLKAAFEGDGYSKEWIEEAERRGLWNLRTTVDAISAFGSEKNVAMFERLGVLKPAELDLLITVAREEYCHRVFIEAGVMYDMLHTDVVPAGFKYQATVAASLGTTMRLLGDGVAPAQNMYLKQLSTRLAVVIERSEVLKQKTEEFAKIPSSDLVERCLHARDELVPAMHAARVATDDLEARIPHELWPYPYYREMVYSEISDRRPEKSGEGTVPGTPLRRE